MEEPENKGNRAPLLKTGMIISFGIAGVIAMACCYCFFFVQSSGNKNEQGTGEVYILRDEVVETGYIHSDRNDNNY